MPKSEKTIITECECEFLVLTNADLEKCLQLDQRKRLVSKVTALQTLDMFSTVSFNDRLKLSNMCKFRAFDVNEIIPSHSSNKQPYLYFLLNGNVHVLRNNPKTVCVSFCHGLP